MLAWGIVPNTEAEIAKETTISLVGRLEAAMDCLIQNGVSKREMLKSSFIQPSCNTLGVSSETCERILTAVREISDRMRAIHLS
jgi:hypothetical protein